MVDVVVDFYADTFRSGGMSIPEEMAEDLRGDPLKETSWGKRNTRYWNAIAELEKYLAGRLGLEWKEHNGHSNRSWPCKPVQIMGIKKANA